jgi:hypothetical protein
MSTGEYSTKINNISLSDIKDKFHNKLSESNIQKVNEIFKDLQSIFSIIEDKNIPTWLFDSVEQYGKHILSFYDTSIKHNDTYVSKMWASLYLNISKSSDGSDFSFPSIPSIQSWLESNLHKNINESELQNTIKNEIERNKNISEQAYTALLIKMNEMKVNADSIIASLSQASGNIAVEKYAEIFSSQALEYSDDLFCSKRTNRNTIWSRIISGKAQVWIIVAFLFCGILLYMLLNIDKIIKIDDDTWKPNSVAHLIGRSIIISLNIFLISFCFKQYRINKHLYTLNLHRANTLKSFEYLTKAPDKLDGSSYNAILMKVAESIYDAGHTGYISSNDSNTDMPSIIDMTKVITSGGRD